MVHDGYDDHYWLTVQEAAAHMKVSPKTIRNWVKRGYLKAMVLGPRCMRISIDAISHAYRPYGQSYSRTR
jgi:excisionase family DNA binding protein